MHTRPHGVSHQADIIVRARGGSPDALGRLFAEHADGLLRLAFRLTASTADAEDIVQDVFVGLPEALRHYEERGTFDAWLKRITVRCALMRMRSGARGPQCENAFLNFRKLEPRSLYFKLRFER